MTTPAMSQPLSAAVTPLPVAPRGMEGVIAVASGKGGVGKTWFAVTLAQALAQGPTGKKQKVLLFDGDLGLANVDIQLGLMPEADLASVLEGNSSLRGAVSRFAPGGFDILAGRSGSGSLTGLTLDRLNALRAKLAELAGGYGRVVIDLGAGIDRATRQLALQAETVLIVTTEEPTALTDAYAFIKLLHGARPDVDVRVVVNLARTLRDGERTYDTLARACQNFLKTTPPLLGVIRQDRHVRDAIRAQAPLLVRSPHSDAARDVEAIAAHLLSAPASPPGNR